MEMMEFNESVDDCGSDRSCMEEQERLNNERLSECENNLQALFHNHQYAQVRRVCERMHFLERIKDTIEKKLRHETN